MYYRDLMKPRDQHEGAPRILAYRTDESGSIVAFPIERESRGIDVIATLLYLDSDKERLYAHASRILRHAVEGLGLLNNVHLPIPRTSIQLSGQIALMEHVHFGNDTTFDDVSLAIEITSGTESAETEKLRLTSALIDTGSLTGLVIETVQRNEFITSTEGALRAELHAMTENHYDL